MGKKKPEVSLTPFQQQKLTEWEEKIKSGEAYKMVENDFINNVSATCDPQRNIKRFAKNLYPKSMITGEEFTEEEQGEFYNLAMSYGIDNGFSILESVDVGCRGMIYRLRKELIKEFNCTTYSEKALVDLAISAYARNVTYSKKLLCLRDNKYLTHERNGLMSMLSKEIDKANRHFITAIETLKQFKQPQLKINVKTKNAFIAEKQQFNNNQNEKIKTK
jgi:hypothetical protein